MIKVWISNPVVTNRNPRKRICQGASKTYDILMSVHGDWTFLDTETY